MFTHIANDNTIDFVILYIRYVIKQYCYVGRAYICNQYTNHASNSHIVKRIYTLVS